MLDADGVIAKMSAAGVDRVVMIPTMHAPIQEPPERLLRIVRGLMQRRPTRKLAELVHRLTLTRDGAVRVGREKVALYARPDNAGVAELLARYPKYFLGWIFLNPREPDCLEELERWRSVPGFIGVKLHPHWHDYETALLDPLLQRLEELGLPALFHLGFGARGDFRAICSQFPRLVVISAHAGFPFYRDLWAHAATHPNLYVDLSSPYIDEALARRAVEAMGPERCLYGTDAPYGFHAEDQSYDYTRIKGWIERLPVPSAKRDDIFAGNFASLVTRAGITI